MHARVDTCRCSWGWEALDLLGRSYSGCEPSDTKFKSSGSAADSLNHRAISVAQLPFFECKNLNFVWNRVLGTSLMSSLFNSFPPPSEPALDHLILVSLKPAVTHSDRKHSWAGSSLLTDHHPAVCPWHTPRVPGLLFCAVRHAGDACCWELPLSLLTGRGTESFFRTEGIQGTCFPWHLWFWNCGNNVYYRRILFLFMYLFKNVKCFIF